MTDIPSQSRQGRVVLTIVLVALFVVVVCALVMFFIKTQNVEQVGVNKAKALADQIKILRTFYTKEVVSRAKQGGLRINYDWVPIWVGCPDPCLISPEAGSDVPPCPDGVTVCYCEQGEGFPEEESEP